MEIREFDEITGVVTTEDIVEGRMVLFTSHAQDYDFGSRTDLPGVKLPTTAEEAKWAKCILTWAVTQTKPPYYVPQPAYTPFTTRGGWGETGNLPMTSTTVYMTYPGYQDGVTIPSGTPALAFEGGKFTIPSGGFIDSANIQVVGHLCSVSYAASTKGKLQYSATMDDSVAARVEGFDSTSYSLTVALRSMF